MSSSAATGRGCRLYTYRLINGKPAAKCLCGWAGEGEEAIAYHRAFIPDSSGQVKTEPVATWQLAHGEPNQFATRKEGFAVALLRAYANFPNGLTNEEAWVAASDVSDAAIPETGYWKRCSELATFGLIEPTGETRKAKSGRKQRVHRITRAGVAHLARVLHRSS